MSSDGAGGQNYGAKISVTLDKLVRWWEKGGMRQIADLLGVRVRYMPAIDGSI